MPLLVAHLKQRHMERFAEQSSLRDPRQKTGHVAALHRPGAGAHAHSRDAAGIHIRKQPAGKLRQALDMCKQRIALTQTKLPLLNAQKPGAVDPILPVKPGNGSGVVAGIKADGMDHCATSSAGDSSLPASGAETSA